MGLENLPGLSAPARASEESRTGGIGGGVPSQIPDLAGSLAGAQKSPAALEIAVQVKFDRSPAPASLDLTESERLGVGEPRA